MEEEDDGSLQEEIRDKLEFKNEEAPLNVTPPMRKNKMKKMMSFPVNEDIQSPVQKRSFKVKKSSTE